MTPTLRFWLHLLMGFAVWALGFAAIYGLHGLGCAYRWNAVPIGPVDALRALLGLVALLTLAALAVLFRRQASSPGARALLPGTALAATGGAALATLLTFAPIALVASC